MRPSVSLVRDPVDGSSFVARTQGVPIVLLSGATEDAATGALAPKNQKSARRRSFGSPSRFRFRPPFALTFGFRLRPSGSASSYLRSVLGARGNLGVRRSRHKRSGERKARNLDTPRTGRPLSRGSILVRMRPVSPNQLEPGQGALALRPADAPGGWGETVAPTRSDRRQSDRMALAFLPASGAVSTAEPTTPTRYERSASTLPHPNVRRKQGLGPGRATERLLRFFGSVVPGRPPPPSDRLRHLWRS